MAAAEQLKCRFANSSTSSAGRVHSCCMALGRAVQQPEGQTHPSICPSPEQRRAWGKRQRKHCEAATGLPRPSCRGRAQKKARLLSPCSRTRQHMVVVQTGCGGHGMRACVACARGDHGHCWRASACVGRYSFCGGSTNFVVVLARGEVDRGKGGCGGWDDRDEEGRGSANFKHAISL